MATVIALVLIVLLILFMWKISKEYFSPSCILLYVWFAFFSLLCLADFFSLPELSMLTIVSIIIALGSFCLGEAIFRVGCISKSYIFNEYIEKFRFHKYFLSVFTIIALVFSTNFFFTKLDIAGIGVGDIIYNINSSLYVIRKNAIDNLGNHSLHDNIRLCINFICITIYSTMYDTKYSFYEKCLIGLITVSVVFNEILTASKQAILIIFIAIFILEIVKKNKITEKLLGILFMLVSFIVIMILILNNGNILDVSHSNMNNVIVSLVRSYILLGVYGFENVILYDFDFGYNGGWLKPIIAVFYRVGLSDFYPITHMNYFSIGGFSSNIYTGLISCVQHYGLIELVIVIFINGFVYMYIYEKAKKNDCFYVALYCLTMVTVVLSPINGDFFCNNVISSIKYLLLYHLGIKRFLIGM